MVDTLALWRQRRGYLAPGRSFSVVNNMVRTVRLQDLRLGLRRRGSDDRRTSGLRELHREDRHAPRSLREHNIPRRERLEPVERVPGRERGARERGAFLPVQGRRHLDEAVLVECSVLAERAIENAAQAGRYGLAVEGAAKVGLVEEGEDFGALFEARYLGPDGDDLSCSVLGMLVLFWFFV